MLTVITTGHTYRRTKCSEEVASRLKKIHYQSMLFQILVKNFFSRYFKRYSELYDKTDNIWNHIDLFCKYSQFPSKGRRFSQEVT